MLTLALWVVGCGASDCASDATDCNPPLASKATQTNTMPVFPDPERQWDAFVDTYIQATFAHQPDWAVRAGRHEFDGVFADRSAPGLERSIQHFDAARDALDQMAAATLTAAAAFERDLIRWHADAALLDLAERRRFETDLTAYFDALAPDTYIDRAYAPARARMIALTRHARGTRIAMRQLRETVSEPLPRVHLEAGIDYFTALVDFYENDASVGFEEIEDRRLQEELNEAFQEAIHGLRQTLVWLRSASSRDEFGIGREHFENLLRRRHLIDAPLAELRAAASAAASEQRQVLADACERIGRELNTCLALATPANRSPVLEELEAEVARLRQAAQSSGLQPGRVLTLPLPAHLAHRAWDGLLLAVSGVLESELVPSTLYVSDAANQSWAAPQIANHTWPGRLALLDARRRLPRQAPKLLTSEAYAMAWGLVTEGRAAQANPAAVDSFLTTAQRLLLLELRLINAIDLHTGKTTPAEAKQLVASEALVPELVAEREIRRIVLDPSAGVVAHERRALLALQRQTGTDGQTFTTAARAFGAPPSALLLRHFNAAESHFDAAESLQRPELRHAVIVKGTLSRTTLQEVSITSGR